MWWLWPHLRRLWAAAGTISAGLTVNYLYGWLRNQPAPTLARFTDYLWRCRESGGEKLVEILYRIAPAWLAHMPSLVRLEDRARLQGLAQVTTQQRMLREMAEALEVIAAETPLVLYLEDLHWSDPSTLDLIAKVARRREPARLMILGTYRPVEMLAGKHPLLAMKDAKALLDELES